MNRLLLIGLLLLPMIGLANEVSPTDPRIVGAFAQSLQAQVALLQSVLVAERQDAEAREATLIEWLKAAQQNEKKE